MHCACSSFLHTARGQRNNHMLRLRLPVARTPACKTRGGDDRLMLGNLVSGRVDTLPRTGYNYGTMSDPLPRNAATIDLSSQQNLRALVTYLVEDEDAHPLGVRVVEPPRETNQSVRGSLFAIAELTPANSAIPHVQDADPALDALSDKLLSTLQRSYYTVRGSQSAVLAEAMRNAHQVVQEYNAVHEDSPLRVSVACATLMKRRLMISCSGAAFMILRNGERVELYPTEPGALRPVAPDDPRSYEVLRWDLSAGDVILLAGAGWAERVPMKTLAATVYYLESGMASEAALGLQEQAGGAKEQVTAPGLLLEIVADREVENTRPLNPLLAGGGRAAGSVPAQKSASAAHSSALVDASHLAIKEPATQEVTPTYPASPVQPVPPTTSPNPLFPQRAPGALPTALPVAPQTVDGLEPAATAAADHTDESVESTAIAHEYQLQPIAEPLAEPLQFPQPNLANTPQASVHVQESKQDGKSDLTTRASESLSAGMDKARGFFRTMLPDKHDKTPEGFALLDSDGEESQPNLHAYPESTGQGWSPAAPAETRAPVFTPPAPTSGSRARLIISIAVLIALLVPIAMGAWTWRRSENERVEAQRLIEMAAALTLNAGDALDRDDKRAALNYLSEGEDLLDRAEELVGPSTPMNDLRAEMRRLEMDGAEVQPLYQLTRPLVTFPSGSAATEVLVRDQDIYVLDPGRGQVDRYRMDESLELVPDATPIPVIRTGDVIDGATVGPLIDMAWLPIVPGYDDRPTLVALDANNQIFRYDPRVEGAMRLVPGGAATLQSVKQMEVFQGRLYLADLGLEQVLRYNAGLYTGNPSPWFSQATNLDEMKAMQIDGDIWVLVKNGQVLRYNQGQQLPYSLDSSVGLVRDAVAFYVGDGTNPYIYVVDGVGERIWVYDKTSGEYVKQFAAPEGDPLRGLSNLYIEGVNAMYILTQNALYKHPFPQD